MSKMLAGRDRDTMRDWLRNSPLRKRIKREMNKRNRRRETNNWKKDI